MRTSRCRGLVSDTARTLHQESARGTLKFLEVHIEEIHQRKGSAGDYGLVTALAIFYRS
jgi:hypothetical protein